MESIFFELTIVFMLILANGFFAGAELAIISARRGRIAALIEAGDGRARIVDEMQRNPHRFLATVQIGVTVVGSFASAVGGAAAVEYLKPLLQAAPSAVVRQGAEPLAIALVVALVSYLSLVLGELVPKTIGLQYADRMALLVARPIHLFSRVGAVAVSFLTLSSRAVLAIFGIRAEEGQAHIGREELRHIVSEGEQGGALSEMERIIIENLFEFAHTAVCEVMVPRPRIVGLDLDLPREAILRTVRENMYSRYPVYHGDIDHVIGFLHSKDLLAAGTDLDLATLVRPPFYVPEEKKAGVLLREMQRRRVHLALVVDEYGGISGLVTTEDLLEELVGEIEDEHDVGEPQRVQRLADGSLLVDALLSIGDLEELLGVRLGEDLPFETLAGLILHRLGRFPGRGETLDMRGYTLVCQEVTETSIVRVRIVPADQSRQREERQDG